MQQRLNINQLSKSIAETNGCSIFTAETFVKSLFSLIGDKLIEGEHIKIKGFGEFYVDNEKNIIFNIDDELTTVINQPFSCFEPVELDDDVTDDVFKSEIPIFESKPEPVAVDTIRKEPNEKLDELIQDNNIHEQEKSNIVLDVEPNNPEIEEIDSQQKKEDNLHINENSENEEESQKLNIHENIDDEKNTAAQTRRHVKYYIATLSIGMVLGFVMGYCAKIIIDNNELVSRLNKQQMLIDSIMGIDSHNNFSINSIDSFNLDSVNIIKEKDSQCISNPCLSIDTTAVVTDIISKTRFLTTMARHHYGNLNFWVYIYEENKTKLGHPDRIKPGTVVIIPPATKYNIDANNFESIQKAKVKSSEIYKRYHK